MISCLKVKGESMEPFCREGDFVLSISYLSPRFNRLVLVGFLSQPKIGDIVVLRHPQKEYRLIIKRIIRVKETKNKLSYWVQGDNAQKSSDSRDFGYVLREEIVGRAYSMRNRSHFFPKAARFSFAHT